MFTVKTRLSRSPIDGWGVFADEFIPQGTVVWRFNPLLDVMLEPAELRKFTEMERAFLKKYSYFNKVTGKYVLAVDDSRFLNHAEAPNLVPVHCSDNPETLDVAVRDIFQGEELTSDYREFDGEADIKLNGHAAVVAADPQSSAKM